MLFLLAYDIADPRRLQRVARVLERHAVRCQKSVFLFRGDVAGVTAVLDEVEPLLDLAADVIQAWQLAQTRMTTSLLRGTPLEISPSGVVLTPQQRLFVVKPEED